ncbi:MAG: hypothetical protein MZV70_06480 [Desulfobacterales bacterium]|nr:hypothetical protein [Desulfobacterales bacterium]
MNLVNHRIVFGSVDRHAACCANPSPSATRRCTASTPASGCVSAAGYSCAVAAVPGVPGAGRRAGPVRGAARRAGPAAGGRGSQAAAGRERAGGVASGR